MSHSTRVLIALVLTAIGPFSASAQGRAALIHRLDSIAGAEVRANRSVGIVAAVFKGKDKLLLEAYGKADVEGNAAMTAGTMITIGSVTKQFTAVAILQLRDLGKLSLDDDVTKWLPELNTGGTRVTLRHVLAHTGGITDMGAMPEMRAMQIMRNATVTRDSLYTIISRYPLAFPPGSMQSYSNTGYWLLGRVIEKASGVTYEEYIEKRIFAPLGMSRSMYCDNSKLVPDRAKGYGMRRGTPARVPDIVYTPAVYAGGGICSTGGDMITWLQALHGGKVLSPKSYAELIAPPKLNDGTTLRYALGTVVAGDSHDLRYIGHSGGGFGFSAEARWYPDAQLAVVILTNSEPDAITMTTEDIAAAVLPPPRAAGPFAGDPSPLLGRYQGPANGRDMAVIVTHAPQGLAFAINGQPAETLPWVEGLTFRRRDVLLSFRADTTSQQAAELRFDTGGDHFILKRVSSTTTPTVAVPLAAFEGTYEGQQPGTTVRIAVENDTLRVLPSAGGKGNLIPESGMTFYNGRVGAARTVTFNLGSDGKVTSMTLKGPGTERTLKKLP